VYHKIVFLQETEEIFKIFGTRINTAEKKPRLGLVVCSVLDFCFLFDVGSWKFDVGRSSFKPTQYGINTACKQSHNNLALMGRTITLASRLTIWMH
jgi:hypothetical protein